MCQYCAAVYFASGVSPLFCVCFLVLRVICFGCERDTYARHPCQFLPGGQSKGELRGSVETAAAGHLSPVPRRATEVLVQLNLVWTAGRVCTQGCVADMVDSSAVIRVCKAGTCPPQSREGSQYSSCDLKQQLRQAGTIFDPTVSALTQSSTQSL